MDSATTVAAPYLPTQPGRGPHGLASGPLTTDPNVMFNQFAAISMGGMPVQNGNGPVPMAHGPALMLGSDGQYVLAPLPGAQPVNMGQAAEHPFYNFQVGPGPYRAAHVNLGMPLMPFTPNRAPGTQARVDRGPSEVPGLENRRGSYSTTESTPATPFYGAVAQRENGPRVASLDRSTYTTPSPQQLAMNALHVEQPKFALTVVPDHHLEELLKKYPPIPKAVPAVFTPPGQMKGVEQSLENRIPGNRNVYIRGLHPTTDDELLYKFASRFGTVETSKAIIDTGTGACKGFGFAKFASVKDSEMCIRGFHRLGYEVGFARESFNSRLKAEGDEGSTNLYISNLPKSLTEVELGAIFLGYTILSSKILRDSMGNSRGVGFARFECRDVCDEVIDKFNGLGIGEEGLLMNIRYADTPAQKELKRVTQERRQFRTNEYNIGAYGTPLVGVNPAMYSQPAQWRRPAPPSRSDFSVSPRNGGNMTSHSGSQQGQSRTPTSPITENTTVTTNSSECDGNITIRADPQSGVVANGSVLSTSTAAKEEK